LSPLVGKEEGIPQGLPYTRIPDVAAGIVYKSARFHIPRCVNVKIAPSTGNAPVYSLPVVPEVSQENRLGLPQFVNTLVHVPSLLRGCHEIQV